MSDKLRFVETGNYTREVARSSPHQLIEKYRRERQALIKEKSAVESRLQDLQYEHRQKQLRVTQRRLNGRDAIEATQEIEAAFAEEKKAATKELLAINERLQVIKGLIRDKEGIEDNQRTILLRIEALLLRLVELQSCKSDTGKRVLSNGR